MFPIKDARPWCMVMNKTDLSRINTYKEMQKFFPSKLQKVYTEEVVLNLFQAQPISEGVWFNSGMLMASASRSRAFPGPLLAAFREFADTRKFKFRVERPVIISSKNKTHFPSKSSWKQMLWTRMKCCDCGYVWLHSVDKFRGCHSRKGGKCKSKFFIMHTTDEITVDRS